MIQCNNYVILILLTILIGMIFGIMYQNLCELHGPNAKKICRKVFYSKRLNKYIQFGVHPMKCPQKSLLFDVNFSI